jgi:hypothetical protein
MAKIVNGLKDLNVSEKIEYAKSLSTSLTGNPNITIDPTILTKFGTNTTTLETKLQTAKEKKAESKTATAEQNAAEATLDKMISDIANIVNGTLSDPAKLLTTGFSLASEGAPVELVQVQNLSITSGDDEGELDTHWEPVKSATGYSIALSTDITKQDAWKIIKTVGKVTKYTITELTSGTKYWVRISASKGAASGAWSDPATKIAP